MKPKVTLLQSGSKPRQPGPQSVLSTSLARMRAHILHLGPPAKKISASHGLGPGTELCM